MSFKLYACCECRHMYHPSKLILDHGPSQSAYFCTACWQDPNWVRLRRAERILAGGGDKAYQWLKLEKMSEAQ